MKSIFTAAILFLIISTNGFSSNYNDVMKESIKKMYKSTSVKELTDLANRFERISQAEKNKWLPNYYAAYCFVRTTFFEDMDNKSKHQQLDKAQLIIDKLKKEYKTESEIFALQALVYQLRITDMSLGYKYSKMAGEAIGIAEKLNPKNPRVYYLRGSNTFHTPKFFGGGAEKAKPDLQKAAECFESYLPKNDLMPSWGADHNKQLLSKCNE